MIEAFVVLAAGWLIGTVVGWLTTRDARTTNPINWRILIGPWCYGPWIERQEARP